VVGELVGRQTSKLYVVVGQLPGKGELFGRPTHLGDYDLLPNASSPYQVCLTASSLNAYIYYLPNLTKSDLTNPLT